MSIDMGMSAKEIVELLLKGKKITLEFLSYKGFQLFYSNLNVEKSRKRHAHIDFGLDFENKIIKTIPQVIPAIETPHGLEFAGPTKVTFFASEPTPAKKYAIFSIED